MSRSGQPPDLKKYMDKKLQIKLNANRMVVGTLRGFDQFMNLVVDNTVEVNGDDKNDIGMVVIRGNSVVTVEALEPVARTSERRRTKQVQESKSSACFPVDFPCIFPSEKISQAEKTEEKMAGEGNSGAAFPAVDVDGELNPANRADFQVDPVSSQIDKEKAATGKKKEGCCGKDAMKALRRSFIASGVILAVAGAVFVLSRKMRDR
ncbi:hypothetical protein Nepgr_028188 [Nepenthes gracilis]|uniref:Small nuclear ribonucleoprotein G n=1 Tax=Nepenthes gracilis TaxID=150966 RepID=A0AAD3T9V0_NEPGR|nr:hypothetical protein Nepgr_028188 [Nepenthes gracilis]